MTIKPAENIRKYIEDEKTVPLVKVKGSTWYSITEAERESLVRFIKELDSVSVTEWEVLTEGEKWAMSCAFNDADRILRNSIIRTEN